jgi:hypothetical protein
MGGEFTTVLEWTGSYETGLRLVELIPEGIESNLAQSDQDESGVDSSCKLTINVQADSLGELRKIVDDLLASFSDQDQ